MNFLSALVIVFILIIIGIFLIRTHVIAAMSIALKVTFVTFILMLLSVILVPSSYNLLAQYTLEQSGTLDKIREVDDAIALDSITETATNIWSDLEDLFNLDSSKDKSLNETEEDIAKKGLLEENLYPGMIDLIANIYKIVIAFISVAGSIGIIYLSYSTSAVEEVEKLKRDTKHLDNRLQRLEESMNS